jgi:hypothetical protein
MNSLVLRSASVVPIDCQKSTDGLQFYVKGSPDRTGTRKDYTVTCFTPPRPCEANGGNCSLHQGPSVYVNCNCEDYQRRHHMKDRRGYCKHIVSVWRHCFDSNPIFSKAQRNQFLSIFNKFAKGSSFSAIFGMADVKLIGKLESDNVKRWDDVRAPPRMPETPECPICCQPKNHFRYCLQCGNAWCHECFLRVRQSYNSEEETWVRCPFCDVVAPSAAKDYEGNFASKSNKEIAVSGTKMDQTHNSKETATSSSSDESETKRDNENLDDPPSKRHKGNVKSTQGSTWSLLKHDSDKYTKLAKYVESTVTNTFRSDETSAILATLLQSIAFAFHVASSMPLDIRPSELDDFSGVKLVMLKDSCVQDLCLITIASHTETRLNVTVAGGLTFSVGPESKDNLLLTEFMFNFLDTQV